MSQPITIVILAAGLGTRMKSKKPKVLHHAGGVPLIEHIVGTALELTTPERVFVVVGSGADQVRAAVEGRGVGFVLQTEQGGTGHAVLVCRNRLQDRPGHLLVLYGDCPLLRPETLRRLVDTHERAAAAATVITTVLDDPTGYGRILRDESGMVSAIVEQKAGTPEQLAVREINSGIYAFRSELLWRHIGEIRPDNPVREYYLTDIVGIFRRAGYTVQPMLLEDSTEVLGINTRVELAAIDRLLREGTVRRLMLDGVTIERPETVTIDAGVRIGIDTVVEPFARILGRTVIGEDCRIGACSIVHQSEIGDRAEVLPFTIVDSSRLEAGARVGPYARLRMGAHLEAGAQVGNFVELKKTRLGAGSKSMHLAYLGDASIGSKVNIGAGTITCNYDGLRKHPTHIGDGSFIGSNATLVAPLEVGPGSYVGAGSVITDPVPADALALGRSRQVNKEGWAKKRREQSAKSPVNFDERR
jgi:bifunctional UDP-N-acetylglucosamine pyrophosphorylase/glucosamine-1-phosphate N-acetyltransferase